MTYQKGLSTLILSCKIYDVDIKAILLSSIVIACKNLGSKHAGIHSLKLNTFRFWMKSVPWYISDISILASSSFAGLSKALNMILQTQEIIYHSQQFNQIWYNAFQQINTRLGCWTQKCTQPEIASYSRIEKSSQAEIQLIQVLYRWYR